MKKCIVLIFVNVLLHTSFLFGKKSTSDVIANQYAVDNIAPELLKNANAVVRMDEKVFELKSPKNATMTHKYAITILNYKADGLAHFQEFYDPWRKISSIKGTVYDKNGKQIKKTKKKDIIDASAVSGFYEDNRIKVIEILNNEYPFTVEFEYKIKYSGLLAYPTWDPIPKYKVSVQQSSYKLLTPSDMDFRYKGYNISIEPKISSIKNKKIYEWELENFSALKYEPYSPSSRKIFPHVFFSPNDFEYDGYKGNMKDWESYGKWLYDLAEGRDELDSETIKEIQQLVMGVDDKKEKVRIIYEHLQSKTRYISIQLGIGGWQPFKAKDVDKTGYGDCKGLSNYTRAMLKSVGVKSYNAAIGAGPYHLSFDEDFPCLNHANHMILCVPLEQDTIWLECTSQNQPFAYTGTFTDNRNALLITEDGGKIVRTTSYDQSMNTQTRNATVKIDRDGNAIAKVNTKYRGIQYGNVEYQFLRNEKEKKEELYERLDISNMELEKFNYTQTKNKIPEAEENIEMSIKNYASITGKRIFVPLNILNKRKKAPPRVKNRKTDIVIRRGEMDTDKITYEVPASFDIEHLPKSVSIESDFGTYTADVSQEKNKITYVRTLKIHKKTFPPERYKDLLKFYKKIVRADKMKLVMVEVIRP